MGAPISAILAEVYIQHLEHTSIADTLNKYQIMDYYRYVDDILIVYNEQKTNIINALEDFNAIHSKLKFTMEQGTQNGINYLDLTIKKNQNELNFEIYRKPTATDLILHNTSCHPYEHKKSAINYLHNRMNKRKITKKNKKKEKEIIEQILKNNEYPWQIKKKGKQMSSTVESQLAKANGSLFHTLAHVLE
jgi:hypothetical protein